MKDKIVYKNWNFTGNSLHSAYIGREKSLSISSLGIDTLEAEVKTTDPSILQFTKNDPLYHYRDGIKSGVYHVQAIKQAGPNRYTISAVSPLGILANMEHLGGIYTGQTALEVIKEICGPVPVLVKTRLEDIAIYGWLPIATARDNLRQVLFAIGANLGTDHNGVLRVEPLWSGYASYIPAERVYIDNASVTQDDPVTSVTVLEHRYTPGTERKDLFEGATYQGQRISFSAPMHTLTAEGFDILESGANYAVVSAGNGKLTGAEYIHTTIEVTRKVSEAQTPNDVRISDATLVSLVNSAAVADRLASYYACRTTIDLDMTTLREKPGEVVKIVNPYNRQMVTAAISSMEEDVSNVVKSTVSALVGFTPAQVGDSDYYTERVVLTGSGTWKKPVGATDCTAVLIGAGQGGASGLMGKAADPGKTSSYSHSFGTLYSRMQKLSVGFGGEGGAPGAGGAGGKVLQVSIPLDDIEELSYNCGTGGAPGAASKDRALSADADKSAPGSAGSNTTFGSYSSASGSSSPTGYYDPITKETFAASGPSGVAGGKGGSYKAGEDDETTGLPAGQTPGPDVVYNGISYHAGANHTDYELVRGEKFRLSAGAQYGAGGGAAAGANGKVSTDVLTVSLQEGSTVSNSSVTAIGGAGGQGGDAVAPAAQSKYGYGGAGGNGGGGAGGSGFSAVTSENDGGAPSWPKNVQITQRSSDLSRGLGSDGAKGGPGCIILYLTIGVKKRTGALVDKSGRFLLGKSGRLLIV